MMIKKDNMLWNGPDLSDIFFKCLLSPKTFFFFYFSSLMRLFEVVSPKEVWTVSMLLKIWIHLNLMECTKIEMGIMDGLVLVDLFFNGIQNWELVSLLYQLVYKLWIWQMLEVQNFNKLSKIAVKTLKLSFKKQTNMKYNFKIAFFYVVKNLHHNHGYYFPYEI